MTALSEIKERFRPVLSELTGDVESALAMIRPAQDAKFGDFQANCAMSLAKPLGKPPREIAQQIVDAVQFDDLCETPEIAGPGFINLRLKSDWLEGLARGLVGDERLGCAPVTDSKKVVVDYSSPNVAKPMHVGHLRSSVIGASLCHILRFAGHDVISDNHIGDWGTQFGMIIFGYKNFVDRSNYESDPVGELARLYRLVNQIADYHANVERLPKLNEEFNEQEDRISELEASNEPEKSKKQTLKKLRTALRLLLESRDGYDKEDGEHVPGIVEKIASVESSPFLNKIANENLNIARLARDETAKLHAGDEENRRLWDEFLPECLKALDAVYDKLGVTFDKTLGESFYQPLLADVVADLKSSGLASDSEGAVCVFIEGNDAPFIVQKSDGAFNYATTDLATIRYRVNEFSADAMLYVVDTRQSEHFKLLFETANRWGYDGVDFRHVNFGTVLGDDGRPFKTRSGDTVGLESLLDEAVARAYDVVVENDPNGELDEETRRSVAQAVGIGGIKYADLHHNRESDYVFSWDKMLARTGDTAAYIQYANARTNGIFRKGGIDRESLRQTNSRIVLSHPNERALVLQIQSFGDVISSILTELRPNLLTQFLFETANSFSAFFRDCHVLNEEDESLRTSRLLLCDLTSRTLTLGLTLLGIDAPERM